MLGRSTTQMQLHRLRKSTTLSKSPFNRPHRLQLTALPQSSPLQQSLGYDFGRVPQTPMRVTGKLYRRIISSPGKDHTSSRRTWGMAAALPMCPTPSATTIAVQVATLRCRLLLGLGMPLVKNPVRESRREVDYRRQCAAFPALSMVLPRLESAVPRRSR